MDILPNEEIETATKLLVKKYKVSKILLNKMLGGDLTKDANYLLKRIANRNSTIYEITKRLVCREGPKLFGGSKAGVRELRTKLLQQLETRELKALYKRHPSQNKRVTSPSYMIRPLAEKTWKPRGPWPLDFVKTLGFPEVFAGVRKTTSVQTIDEVQPLEAPPKLVEFQEYLKDKNMIYTIRKHQHSAESTRNLQFRWHIDDFYNVLYIYFISRAILERCNTLQQKNMIDS